MKIAIVCFNLSWQAGGPRLIFSLAQTLKKSGHQVTIYTPDFNGEHFKELWEGLNIKVVTPKNKISWSGGSQGILSWIKDKIRKESLQLEIAEDLANAMDSDFDVVNLHDYAYRVARFYKYKNPKAKIVWTDNDPPYMFLPKKNPIRNFLGRIYVIYKNVTSRRFFKYIDTVTVLDFYNRDWCEKRGIKAVVSRLGVDFENFYHPVKDFTENTKTKSVKIMGLGALNPYRRYEDIVLAVKILKDSGYNAEALIVSKDAWDEREYREKLIDLVEKNKLNNFVKFMFEGASEAELRNAFKNSDVFAYPVYLPPPRNGFGFSIGALEAVAAGLPLIICHTTTSSEVLEDGKTALFVDPMRPDQIAAKVKLLIDNPETYRRIALDGQNFVKSEMTWDKYTKILLQSIEG